MNKNYIKLNNLGILVDSELHEVSQGNHNVDYYYIAYDVYDYTNGFVDVYATLPDGTKTPPLPTIPCDFEFEGSNYKGFLFKLNNTLTSVAGVLTITFGLISTENNTELCSTQLKIDIHPSDTPTDSTITNLQFEQMQEAIRESYNKSNEALDKANDALYHDATIVKVNGEVQQTWDATYAQKITEESKNLFDINQVPNNLFNCSYSVSGDTITFSMSKAITARFNYLIPVEIGKTYTFSVDNFNFSRTGSHYIYIGYNDHPDGGNYGYLNDELYPNRKHFTFTATTETLYIKAYVSYNDIHTLTITKPMIVEGSEPMPYQEWNGSIIHEKDIKPVLVWENGTPGTSMGTTPLTMSQNFEDGDYIIIGYKTSISSSHGVQYMKVKYIPNTYCRISSAGNQGVGSMTRTFGILNSNTIAPETAYDNGTVNNEKIIIVTVHKSKY